MIIISIKNSATISAFGDILLHGRVYGGTKKKTDFKFEEQLSGVKSLLGKTDLTVGNLETIVAGTEFGLTSFPRFNGPVEIVNALKNMGVDLVSVANNHALDHGEEGLVKSLQNIEKSGLIYDGAYQTKEDSEMLRIFKVNGLNICFLSYTRGTNGIKLPQGKSYIVNTFTNTSVLKLSKKIRKIKSENLADVVILNLHIGEEYHLEPSSKQKEMVRSFADAGANVIIGHHPHVLQSPEWVTTSRGTKTLVAYSLGNFLSGQNGLYRQIGAVLSFKVRKPNVNYRNVVVEEPKYNLTYVNRENRLRYDVYLFKDWITQNEYIETADDKFNSKEVYLNEVKRMKRYINDLFVN